MGGLAALIFGAELLVRGASRLAAAFRISPLVIGLTVVAFGTSAPELAVSLRSAAVGQADLAVGNVVGSNIFNVLFILGLAALIAPLRVDRKLVRLDVPLMVVLSGGVWILALDQQLSRLEGCFLVVGILLYTAFQLWHGRWEEQPPEAVSSNGPTRAPSRWIAGLLAIGGLVLLVLGSRWLVDGAVLIARAFGIGERVIGLTLVAAGTSLPEVATSLIAAFRGERDIAVGNVIGSNLFNLLAVLGSAAAFSANGLQVSPEALAFDLPFMVVVAIVSLPIFFSGLEIDRLEGALFLAAWVAYTVMLYRGTVASPWPVAGPLLAAAFLLAGFQWQRRSSLQRS
ncbi:MAG: calcium/sodium antiporter [Thermoanaerobaculia bacterium]|nr:calcium/sodium antiporter [Thermoanaerobaculia bacterium]